jgi:hypothetical protein
MKKQMSTWIVLSALLAAVPAAAQDAPAKPVNMSDFRHHIYVMEGALARAVDYGAQMLNREVMKVMPGAFMLTGEAQARGVYLEGYGVYFDVQVPSMSQSMMWSMRMMLDQDDAATKNAINNIRKITQGIDPANRAALERSLKQLEIQAAPGTAWQRASGNGDDPVVSPGVIIPQDNTGGTGAASAAGISVQPQAPSRPPLPDWAQDPNSINRAYTEAVTRALVDAILDYSTPMQLAPDQWLTVAARDNEGRDTLAPQDPLEEVVTLIYRIKGADLSAYRSGKIDRDEARKRVQVSQF